MQGLADGLFILPYTVPNYLANYLSAPRVSVNHSSFIQARQKVLEDIQKILEVKGSTPPIVIHRQLGRIMWEYCGMIRNESGLKKALAEIQALKQRFWSDVYVPPEKGLNPELEEAIRTRDFLELAELMCWDALEREESCGGHFREEYQTPEGEALRNDEKFAHVAVWEFAGQGQKPRRFQEELNFEFVKPTQRSYK